MGEWKIGLTPTATKGTPTIIGPLTAHIAWKRLSKPSRAAVAEAYQTGEFLPAFHPNTMHALERHGFASWGPDVGYHLTDAGKAVAKWMVRDG